MKTYGHVLLGRRADAQEWSIRGMPPHVQMMFKRMFPRAVETKYGFYLTDSDAVRSDILWFTQRYPMKISHPKLMQEGVDRFAGLAAEVGRITSLDWTPPPVANVFPHAKYQPYNYQWQAAHVLMKRKRLLLADDVGLGKTITFLASLAAGAPRPAVYVTEPHLRAQAAKEFRDWSNYTTYTVDKLEAHNIPPVDIVVMSYNHLSGWKPLFKDGLFKTVCYDEIQNLRHGEKTARGMAAKVLSDKAEYLLGLSATPIYGRGNETHAIFDNVDPSVLGTEAEFYQEWCKAGREVRDPVALGTYLYDNGVLMRRTEDHPSVNRSMPKPNIIEQVLEYDTSEEHSQMELLKKLAYQVLHGSFAERGQATRALDSRMRQMTGIAKAKQVAAYVEMLLRDNERVMLMGWHNEVYSRWRYSLARYNPVTYNGSDSTNGKVRNIGRFTEGDSRVLLMSLRSGAGLNGLQYNCNHIVFGELDWSPPVHAQCIGRLRRPGQTRQVHAHYLHANGGADPVMMEVNGIKKMQQSGIFDPYNQDVKPEFDESGVKMLARRLLEIA